MFSLSLAIFVSMSVQAQFARTIVAPLTTSKLSGSSGLWDGSDNVFHADGSTLVQKYWNGSAWASSVIDRTGTPLYPSCNSGTSGEISTKFVSGYHDIFYISNNSLSLRHAYWDYWTGEFVCETVESGTMTHPVAVDMDGWPHVYYVDVTRGVLRHAFWSWNGWEKEDIDGPGLGCNCRVGGLVSNTTKTLAAVNYASTQQVFYGTDTGALRHAFKAGGGGGGWGLETLMGPGANVPGVNLPNTTTFGGYVVATPVGGTLHVFGKFANQIRHLWWTGSGWRLATFPIGLGGATANVLTFAATEYLGGWALVSWIKVSGSAQFGDYNWGQGDAAMSNFNFESSYNAYGGPAWIDTYVGGDGYLNAYLTYRVNYGGTPEYSVVDQFWR